MILDLKNFRADHDCMKRLLVALAATAAVMLTITAHTMSFQDELDMEKARAESRQKHAELATDHAAHYASLVAACMRGEQFIWTDPHTGADMAAFCDVEVLGKVGR